MCFLVVDYKFNFVVISLYHTSTETKSKLKYGDEILIWNPNLQFISLEKDKKIYSYPCIWVTSVSDVLVNKIVMLDSFSQETLVTETFS